MPVRFEWHACGGRAAYGRAETAIGEDAMTHTAEGTPAFCPSPAPVVASRLQRGGGA
ncbi:hypothetical protein QE410_001308 [Microbacterium sp. SORGH_AS 1204]|nr:hypothetical protein [Microbacterium sp. SORGH_AS_1204]